MNRCVKTCCLLVPDVCTSADGVVSSCVGLENGYTHCTHRPVQHSKVGGCVCVCVCVLVVGLSERRQAPILGITIISILYHSHWYKHSLLVSWWNWVILPQPPATHRCMWADAPQRAHKDIIPGGSAESQCAAVILTFTQTYISIITTTAECLLLLYCLYGFGPIRWVGN